MDINLITAVGLLAAALTSLGFLPQVIKMLRTRSVADVSVLTLWQYNVGISLWVIYAISLGDAIIIAANSVSLVILWAALLIYYRSRLTDLEHMALTAFRNAVDMDLNVLEFARRHAHVLMHETVKSGGDPEAVAEQVATGVLQGANVTGTNPADAVQYSVEGSVSGAISGAKAAGLSTRDSTEAVITGSMAAAADAGTPEAALGVKAGLSAAGDHAAGPNSGPIEKSLEDLDEND